MAKTARSAAAERARKRLAERQEKMDETGLEPITEEMDAPDGAEPASKPKQTLRPSKLAEMIAAHAAETNVPAHTVDAFRFVRDRGLPNPTRLYRVTAKHLGSIEATQEVDAVDPSEAICLAADAMEIAAKERHTRVFAAVVIEE